MGMYCCCDVKLSGSTHIDLVNKEITQYEGGQCRCCWDDWISLYDYPKERKNKHILFSEPDQDGQYLVRYSNCCGDRYETEQIYSKVPRIIQCGYTGKDISVNWSGDDEEQPYAWKKKE